MTEDRNKQLISTAHFLLSLKDLPRLQPVCNYGASSIEFCIHSAKNPSEAFKKCKQCLVGFFLIQLDKKVRGVNMHCVDCKSEDIRYVPPEEWNRIKAVKVREDKKGGYHCNKCGRLFSFYEGIMQRDDKE